jgi:pimeloyl-ACP methyl ester carboxylesterase
MEQFAAKMPQAQFAKIACAGHMSPLEAPAAVNAAIKTFLAL